MTGESTLIICVPRVTKREIHTTRCPHCSKVRGKPTRRKFLYEYEEWYGWTETCLTCGDRWEDGELCPRPRERGWRKEAVKRAKARIGQPTSKPSNI